MNFKIKKSIHFLIQASVLLLMILLVQTGCVKKQSTEQVKSTAVQKEKGIGKAQLLTEDLEKKAAELNQLRQETEALLSSLKEKENNLNKRQAHLDSLEDKLQAREEMLVQEKQSVKNMRSANYILLLSGLVLLAIAIFLLLKARLSAERTKKKDVAPLEGEEKSVEGGVETGAETSVGDVAKEEIQTEITAGKEVNEEKASEMIAEIIDEGGELKEKETEEKPKRKRAAKTPATTTKKTTARRKTRSKPKGGVDKEKGD